MWESDGWDVRARVGVLVPHADVGPESELQAMAPEGVRVHAARVPFGAMAMGGQMDPTIPLAPVRAFVEPPAIDEATALLAAAPIAAIGIGFTSSSYVLRPDGEREVEERLAKLTGGIPVVSACSAAIGGFNALGVHRLAVFSPPWFDAQLDELGAEYFESQELDVVTHGSCELPSNQRSINPAELFAWVATHTPPDAEAVFLGGNGFRAVGVITALEEQLRKPIVTANSALLWGLLHAAGTNARPKAYGQLFAV
ncbi:maleate isomerase [Kribbella jejuensis]|uniref:Maleate isomerase n=2 Tax=Kribbella jejuensis TaxID=236068 RepID=A0A542DSY1_9ACTN|nr:maleate isomerase [Kribbella jejuensis]